jgi:hypothetical protein
VVFTGRAWGKILQKGAGLDHHKPSWRLISLNIIEDLFFHKVF